MKDYVVICEINGRNYVPEEKYKRLMRECGSCNGNLEKNMDDLLFDNAELELKNVILKKLVDKLKEEKDETEKPETIPLSQLGYEEISESYTFEELVKKCVQQEDEIERVKQINNEQRCALQKYYQKMDAIKELTEG
jgi:predicted ribonuclease YlaK